MGKIGKLIFGPEKGKVEDLRAKYGAPPSQFMTLPNGHRIHYRDEGDADAPTMILVHGHSEDLHTWATITRSLVEKFRVIRFDLRRHGLTGPAPDGQYTIESYASDLSKVVEHLEIENFVLIGHSMGGRISVKFAMENQEKVSRLVLLAPSGAPREQPGSPPLALRLMRNPLGRFLVKRMWSRKMAGDSLIDMVFDGSLITDEEIDRMWDFSMYPGSMEAMFREFSVDWEDFDPEEIGGVTTSTLLIWGEEDTVCPIDMGEWYDSKLPNSSFLRLPGIGHKPHFECPENCLEGVSSWMAQAMGGNLQGENAP